MSFSKRNQTSLPVRSDEDFAQSDSHPESPPIFLNGHNGEMTGCSKQPFPRRWESLPLMLGFPPSRE